LLAEVSTNVESEPEEGRPVDEVTLPLFRPPVGIFRLALSIEGLMRTWA
jgi:hypothetical protein